MPLIINLAANVALGSAFAVVARRSPAMRETIFSWPLFFLLALEAAIMVPAATFLFRFYPQWSMLYVLDPQIHPEILRWIGMLSVPVVVLTVAGAWLGYAVSRHGICINRKGLVYLPAISASAIIALTLLLYPERVLLIGSFDQFWQEKATLLTSRAAGWVGLGSYAAAGALVVWVRQRYAERDPTIV